MKTILSVLFILSLVFTVKSQDVTVYYSIKIKKAPAELKKAVKNMNPGEMTVRTKGTKTYFGQNILGMRQVVVYDTKEKKGFVLMSLPGNKICITMSEKELEEFEKKQNKQPKVEYVKGSKKILNYDCKKAIMTNAEGEEVTIYYSEEIDAKHNNFKFLKGFPLMYTTTINKLTLEMTATTVDDTEVDPKHFEIPSGYKVMTFEEFQEKMK